MVAEHAVVATVVSISSKWALSENRREGGSEGVSEGGREEGGREGGRRGEGREGLIYLLHYLTSPV